MLAELVACCPAGAGPFHLPRSGSFCESWNETLWISRRTGAASNIEAPRLRLRSASEMEPG